MPASGRKSSLGNARNGPKKYIPYRADDFHHGKKTGMNVELVDHTDEFEPFEKVISQADKHTPYRPQNTRKKRVTKTPVPVQQQFDDDDEYGEMSMELDDSTPRGPSAYFAHTRTNTITSSVQRIGSSSRPVWQQPDVNYDEVPSPSASPSYKAANKRAYSNGKTPVRSRLSQSTVAQDDDDESDGDPGVPNYDYGDDGADMEIDSPPPPPSRTPQASRTPRHTQTPRRPSFATLAEEGEPDDQPADWSIDDIGDGDVEEDQPLSAKSRGKQRASAVRHADEVDEMDVEHEIAQGLNDAELEPIPEEDEPVEEQLPPPKKGKKGRAAKNSRKENEGVPRGRPRTKKDVLREVTPEENTDGLRRSKRRKYSPLAWWRLEKVVYGRRENGPCLVPSIKEIHRIPQEPPKPLGAKHKYRRKKTQSVEPELGSDPLEAIVYDPEEGWDDETDPHCKVLEYGEDDVEVERRVAFTAKMVQPKAAAQGAFYFQKIFGDADFLAAGQLIIPPKSTKPTKGTKDNSFVFYVIQGAVKFTVHQTSMVLSTGGMFMVPRGNVYYIQNICDRDAKLFFAQARKLSEDFLRDLDDAGQESDADERPRSRSKSAPRSQFQRASSDTVNGDAPEPEPRPRSRGKSKR